LLGNKVLSDIEIKNLYDSQLYENSEKVFNRLINAPILTNLSFINGVGINISWTDRSDNEEYFIIYKMFGQNGSWQAAAFIEPNKNSFLDRNYIPFASYNYSIKALNISLGYSNLSNSKKIIILISGEEEINLNAHLIGRSINLTWGGIR